MNKTIILLASISFENQWLSLAPNNANTRRAVMTKEVIATAKKPGSPLSPGIRAGEYIFVSGQIGHVDDEGRELSGIEVQAKQCLENMKSVLDAAGASLGDVIKVTVFLTSPDDFDKMNEVYRHYFPIDQPARSTIITGLVRPSMLVEMECVAYHPKPL
jgi:2-iminobutanoate/2-iminopropanoate deaminase